MVASMAKPLEREMNEGPDADERFKSLLGRIVQVPKTELAKRESEYQQSRAEKPAAKKKTSHR
jgi:hypothetical protein